MSDRVVGDGELGQVVANHVLLNVDQVEDLAVVDSGGGTNHLGEDDHVTDVGLDRSRLVQSGKT